MMRLGFTEILLILVLALVLFGGGKLAGVGKALGQSIREFKKELGTDGAEAADKAEATEAPEAAEKQTETKA